MMEGLQMAELTKKQQLKEQQQKRWRLSFGGATNRPT
jgi:hypothetical protein